MARALTTLIFSFVSLFFFVASAESNTLGYSTEQSLLVSSEDQVIGSNLGYLRSPTEDFRLRSVSDIKALLERFEGKWQPNKSNVPNFGYSHDTFLFHIQLKNDSINTITRYLEIGYPLLEEVDVYLYTIRGAFEHFTFGGGRRFGERPVKHRNFLAPIELYAKNKVHIFVRVRSYSSVQVPIRLISPQNLFEEDQNTLLINGIYLGLMISLLFYNLLLYFSVGDKNYLFYVGNVIFVMMVQSGLQGYTFMYFWPDNPKVTYYYMPFTIGAAGFVMSIFVSRFLELKLNYPRLHKVFRFSTLFLLFSSLSVFLFGYEVAIKSGFIANFLLIFLAQGAGFYVWLKGYQPARFFTIAYLSFFLGTFLLMLNKLGYLPRNFVTENGQALGILLQIIFLSVAMADRIGLMQMKRKKEQEAFTHSLESQVEARTNELSEAVLKLEDLNKKLERQTRVDGLTGVLNRRSFNEILNRDWAHAFRNQTKMALIMCDVDNFKELNDKYGHLVGDDCLRVVSSQIRLSLKRQADVLFRYGGEEFAILLRDTDLQGALLVAERARREIEKNPIEIHGKKVTITASFGCSEVIPPDPHDFNILIHQADSALYHAKRQGKNKVVSDA